LPIIIRLCIIKNKYLSSTIAAYAPIGAGVPELKLDKSIGIMKAYLSCVGEGPFTCEYFGKDAERLRVHRDARLNQFVYKQPPAE